MVLTLKERIFIVEHYFATKSYKTVLKMFKDEFPGREPPNNSSVSRIVAKFREYGTVRNLPHDREKTALTPQVLATVASELAGTTPSPSTKSLRRVVLEHRNEGLTYGTAHRAVQALGLHPYRIRVVHELLPLDFDRRITFCEWFLNFVKTQPFILNDVFFSDEAWFSLCGYVNSQNNRVWSASNPHLQLQAPLHQQKVGVWCAISRSRVVGPIFFTQTVNSEVYLEIIDSFIALLNDHERYCWLQQDGAKAHTARATMSVLRTFFDDRLISVGRWPPRSPDLNPCDFFLWGHLKDRVYCPAPRNLDELKANITREIKNISKTMLRNVADNIVRRAKTCITAQGSQFEHLL